MSRRIALSQGDAAAALKGEGSFVNINYNVSGLAGAPGPKGDVMWCQVTKCGDPGGGHMNWPLKLAGSSEGHTCAPKP